jgi:hypothetical protein
LATCLLLAGCKSQYDDQKLTAAVQSQLSEDTALTGQPIQTSVQNGVVHLGGTVANDAQRVLAARDAASVKGVQRVVNSIGLGTPQSGDPTVAVVTPPPAQIPTSGPTNLPPQSPPTHKTTPQQTITPPTYNTAPPSSAPIERVPPPPSQPQQPTYTPPPPPPAPTFHTYTLPAGSTIPVRVTQTLDSASTQAGSSFSGTVASDVLSDGVVVIPAGSNVSGLVIDVKDAAHFKGSSSLSVGLSTINRRGDRLSVTTEPYIVQGKGRGANTAEKVGGGAAVGAILGGIFGGGKGAAIGAAAGGGAGAGANAITRGQQVQIPSESIVRFRLSDSVSVRVRDGGDRGGNTDPTLQHHNPSQK